jgi:alkaline phosphatase
MIKKTLFLLITLSCFTVQSQNSKKPNIIMMIGDGMGLSQISSGMYSNNNYTSLERSKYVGLIKTHSSSNLITDSAAAGTAMSSGVKTKNRVVGMDDNYKPVKSILEVCKDLGYSTGIIVTSTIVHATPASYYSKVKSRYQYEDIASQLAKSGINFFVGGGERYFNNRSDNRNLLAEMEDYFFATSIDKYKNNNSNKIGYLTSYDDPIEKHKGREPSLPSLVESTIQKLENLDKPFFLLIESAQIDWGGHDNDPKHMNSEMIEFDNTIKTVFDFIDNDDNTLVVITADHETGGAAITGGDLLKSKVKNKYVSGSHTATMVPVFSSGYKAHNFKGVYDNTEIFNKLFEIVNQ